MTNWVDVSLQFYLERKTDVCKYLKAQKHIPRCWIPFPGGQIQTLLLVKSAYVTLNIPLMHITSWTLILFSPGLTEYQTKEAEISAVCGWDLHHLLQALQFLKWQKNKTKQKKLLQGKPVLHFIYFVTKELKKTIWGKNHTSRLTNKINWWEK